MADTKPAETKTPEVLDAPKDGAAMAVRESAPPAQSARVVQMPPAAPPRPVPVDLVLRDETYAGLSMLELSDDQAAALMRPVTDDEVEIKPDAFGAVYLGHAGYRKRLNEAFRPMGWALRPLSPVKRDEAAGMVYIQQALYAKGHYVGQAIGEQKWHPKRDGSEGGMSWGDAIEGATSNALMRCCKSLGIAMECWDRQWTASFRKRCCIKVFIEQRDGSTKTGWRKKDGEPIEGESGICDDSPNRQGYVRPEPAWWSKRRKQKDGDDRDRPQQAPAKAAAPAAKDAPPAEKTAPPAAKAAEPPKKVEPGDRTISRADARLFWAMVDDQGMDKPSVVKHVREKYPHAAENFEKLTRSEFTALKTWVQEGGD